VVLLLLDGVFAVPRVLRSFLLHQQRVRRDVLLLEDVQVAQLLQQQALVRLLLRQLLRLALLTQVALVSGVALRVGAGSDAGELERAGVG
jgi:hypothetical protein